ncbi:MAG: tyrosine-type recombinase/integrase [Lachnospiraceae bacterium]
MKKLTDFAKVLGSFLTIELPSTRNVSTNTICSYRDTYKQLLLFMNTKYKIKPEQLSIKHLTRDELTVFLEYLESEQHNSISTRNQRLAAIHALFRYIQTQEPSYIFQCQQVLAIPFKKPPKQTVHYLTVEEMEKLLATPDQTTKKGRRDMALLCLLYDSGARVQELADLQVMDLRLSSPAQVTLTGKGRKTRTVPLMEKTVPILEQYLRDSRLDRPEKKEHPLFQNSQMKKLTRQGITYILFKYTDICGFTEMSPHRMRHSKAMHLTEADANPFFIRDILGHADLKTTGVYSRASIKMKKDALDKLNQSSHDPLPQNNKKWINDENLMDWLNGLGK